MQLKNNTLEPAVALVQKSLVINIGFQLETSLRHLQQRRKLRKEKYVTRFESSACPVAEPKIF